MDWFTFYMGCFMRHSSLYFFIKIGFAVLIANIACAAIPPISLVETKEPISVPIVSNGKTIGETTIPTGTKLKVKGVKADKNALEYASKTIVVRIEKTNYGELLESLKKAEEERIAKEKALEEEKAKQEQRKAENMKRITIENIMTEKRNDGTILYTSLRDCNFLFKKGTTSSSDVKHNNYSISLSIVQSDEVRLILTLRRLIGYNIGGFTEKIEFVERTNFNNVSISFVHAERKTIREDPYGGLFDEFVVINDEQKNKLIKILSQDEVYFSWIDRQYHRNEYEMTKDQVFAMREMFLKFTELTSK